MANSKKYTLPPCPACIEILGALWKIDIVPYNKDSYFKRNDADGYCSSPDKRICVVDPGTVPTYRFFNEEQLIGAYKQTMRHEIVHAFLFESGLADSALVFRSAWAINEEMVDWIASQGQKIHKAWADTGCLSITSPERYLAWKTEEKA